MEACLRLTEEMIRSGIDAKTVDFLAD
jgi:hypothetical protein